MKVRTCGDLQVWWIPQFPMKAFEVDVASIEEGAKILDVLYKYDQFQYTNKIKRYCSSFGVLRRWCIDAGDGDPGWEDWYDEWTGENNPLIFLEAKRG